MFSAAIASHENPSQSSRFSMRWGPWLITSCVVVAIYIASPNFRWQPGPTASPYAGDFIHDWIGAYIMTNAPRERLYDLEFAQQVQHDVGIVGYEWNSDKYFPLVYPPFYYVLVQPLAWLSFSHAVWLWGAGMIGCLFTAIGLLIRHARLSWSDGQEAMRWLSVLPWVLPAALLYTPIVESLSSSQKGTICLLIFVATFYLLRSERPFRAGLVFGCMAFKPQLALVLGLALLWKRQWQFVVGAATTLVVLILVTLALGASVCADYWEFSRKASTYVQTAGYDLTESHCLYGFFSLLFGDQNLKYTQLAMLTVGCMVVALLGRLLQGPFDTSSPRFEWQFSGMVVASVLLSPHLFTYDLSILFIPIFLISGAWCMRRSADLILPLALSLALYVTPHLSMFVAAHTRVQVTILLMIGLLFALAGRVHQVSSVSVSNTWRYRAVG